VLYLLGNNNCALGHNISTIVCCTEGFDCVVGWDPVTGFGSINYADFYSAYVPPPADDDSNAPLLNTEGIIAVASVGAIVGAGAIGAGVYYGFYAHAATSSLQEPLTGDVVKSPMV
jgi:hypothetical protein